MSAFSPSPPFLHRSDVKCWIRKMENADVSSPLFLPLSVRFLKGFARKSFVVNHSLSIESLSSWFIHFRDRRRRDSTGAVTLPPRYVLRASTSIPLEIYVADEWENFEKIPKRPTRLPLSFHISSVSSSSPISRLICQRIYFFFTRRFLSEFASQCCFINIITALREARLTRVEAAKSLRSGDSPILLCSISTSIYKAINGIIRRNIRKLE